MSPIFLIFHVSFLALGPIGAQFSNMTSSKKEREGEGEERYGGRHNAISRGTPFLFFAVFRSTATLGLFPTVLATFLIISSDSMSKTDPFLLLLLFILFLVFAVVVLLLLLLLLQLQSVLVQHQLFVIVDLRLSFSYLLT